MADLGISGLDKLVGPVRQGSNILFTGLPGAGKSLFVHKIIYSMLEQGYTVLFVNTDRAPETLLSEVSNLGMNYAKYLKSKNLILIDVYAGSARVKDSLCVDIRDLTRLSLLVDEVLSDLKTDKIIQVYDVLTELFIWTSNDDSILQFVSNACSKTRENGMISLFVINEGAKGQEYVNSIKSVADGVISFGFSDDKRFLSVDKMKGSVVKPGRNYFSVNAKDGSISFSKKK